MYKFINENYDNIMLFYVSRYYPYIPTKVSIYKIINEYKNKIKMEYYY